MKKLKITVSGKAGEVKVKKPSIKDPEGSGLYIQNMLDKPKEKDLLELAKVMSEFKKTLTYKYLELRNTQEMKRLIKNGPAANENWEILGGRLQGLLDQFEGPIKGTIMAGELVKGNKKKRDEAKRQEKEDEEDVVSP